VGGQQVVEGAAGFREKGAAGLEVRLLPQDGRAGRPTRSPEYSSKPMS